MWPPSRFDQKSWGDIERSYHAVSDLLQVVGNQFLADEPSAAMLAEAYDEICRACMLGAAASRRVAR